MTEKLLTEDIKERCAIFDENFADVTERIEKAAALSGRKADEIMLLAATKTIPVEVINHAINNGIKLIGENKVQELLSKIDEYDSSADRHFIGHLQTNKVKDIIDRVELIHSVDSLKLAKEISKQAEKKNKVMDILLEVNIGDEESKWGFDPSELEASIKEISLLSNIRICGIMAIPPICNEPEENRKYFRQMHQIFIDLKSKNIDNCFMNILSMGMSDDFDVAIEEGANLVRVGTALFGKRYYI